MPVNESGVWTPPKAKRCVHVRTVSGAPNALTNDDARKLNSYFNSPAGFISEVEPMAMDIENHAVDAVDKSNAAMAHLRKTLDQFRSVIGNDLTSIKAASSRVQTETQAMAKRYQEAAQALTSPEFERAIQNAERMASAMKALGEISSTRINLSILDGQP